jgi:surfactin synthase thioesterase subunit
VRPNSWIARLRAVESPQIRLFAFPHAGSGAAAFRTWHRVFAPHVDLCAVRLPGREKRLREPPFRQFGALADALEAGLAPELDLPFGLFGHCSGALLAFELARRASAAGRPPCHLFVSEQAAPDSERESGRIHQLPYAELVERLRSTGAVDEEILASDQMMRLLEPALRADLEAFSTFAYTPGPSLDVPVTVFGRSDCSPIPRDLLEGWRRHTRGSFDLHLVEGGHLLETESWQAVAQAVDARLADA